MKKNLLLCFCALMSVMTWGKTHTVQRGESLETIAKTYNITTAQLLEANPSAKDLFYVGLKLEIPETTNNSASDAQTGETMVVSDKTNNLTSTQTISNATSDEHNGDSSGWSPSMFFGWGFLEQPEGTKGPSCVLSVEFSGAYWFMEKEKGIFASAGLGYINSSQKVSLSVRGYSQSTETDFHLISVPLKAGYAISNASKSFAVTPYLGFGLGMTVKGTSKSKSSGMPEYKTKIKSGKFAPDFRIGVAIRLAGFNIGAFYAFPLSDKSKAIYQEDGYPTISIGWGL